MSFRPFWWLTMPFGHLKRSAFVSLVVLRRLLTRTIQKQTGRTIKAHASRHLTSDEFTATQLTRFQVSSFNCRLHALTSSARTPAFWILEVGFYCRALQVARRSRRRLDSSTGAVLCCHSLHGYGWATCGRKWGPAARTRRSWVRKVLFLFLWSSVDSRWWWWLLVLSLTLISVQV